MTALLTCCIADASVGLTSALLFESGATAITEEQVPSGRILRAGFTTVADAEAAIRVLGRAVDARVESIEDSELAWVDAQRAAIRPTVAGRWRIRAPWHRASPDPETTDLVIDPGPAFGHGGHPSTALVLDLLPGVVGVDDQVLDIGTGSGVLAAASASLGATVTAIDHDPVALEVARRNLDANGVTHLVRLLLADCADFDPSPASIALVNVTIDVHRETAANLGRIPTVIVSGLLAHQLGEAIRLYGPRRVLEIAERNGWTAAVLSSSEDASRRQHEPDADHDHRHEHADKHDHQELP